MIVTVASLGQASFVQGRITVSRLSFSRGPWEHRPNIRPNIWPSIEIMARDKQTDSFSSPVPPRGLTRDRHGRGMRGPVTGPHLPRLRGRIDTFFLTVSHTVDYLRGLWPEELADVHFDVAATPPRTDVAGVVERWKVDHERRRIVLYRIPIQRMSRLHIDDDLHRQMMIESVVFRGVAELLGKEPWDLGPERYRH